VDDEGEVAQGERMGQKELSGLALGGQQAGLAGTGIHQNAKGERLSKG